MNVPTRVIAQALRVTSNLITANPLPRDRWIDFDEEYWKVNGLRVEDLGVWSLLVTTVSGDLFMATLYQGEVNSVGEVRITPPYVSLPILKLDIGG